jgi:hypothetical protein
MFVKNASERENRMRRKPPFGLWVFRLTGEPFSCGGSGHKEGAPAEHIPRARPATVFFGRRMNPDA